MISRVLGSGDPRSNSRSRTALRMPNVNTRLGSHCTRNVLTKTVAVLRMFTDTMLRFALVYYMWCDASPSMLKIAALAKPHALLSPATRPKQLRMLFSVLGDGFMSKDMVRSKETPMVQQKQGLQAHDD